MSQHNRRIPEEETDLCLRTPWIARIMEMYVIDVCCSVSCGRCTMIQRWIDVTYYSDDDAEMDRCCVP